MPSTVWAGSVPIHKTIRKAMRRCNCQRSMDLPMKKPAMNRKMISLPYSADTTFNGATPDKGKSTSGSSEVAAISMGSVIHQTAIQRVMAAVICAAQGIPAGVGAHATSKKSNGPEIKAIRLKSMRCV